MTSAFSAGALSTQSLLFLEILGFNSPSPLCHRTLVQTGPSSAACSCSLGTLSSLHLSATCCSTGRSQSVHLHQGTKKSHRDLDDHNKGSLHISASVHPPPFQFRPIIRQLGQVPLDKHTVIVFSVLPSGCLHTVNVHEIDLAILLHEGH